MQLGCWDLFSAQRTHGQHPLFRMCHIQVVSLQLLWLTGEDVVWESILAAMQQPGASIIWQAHPLPWLKEFCLRTHSLAIQSLYNTQRARILLWRVIGWKYNCWNTELGVLIYLHEDNLYSNPVQHLDFCLTVSLWASLKKYQMEHLQKHF